MKIFGRSFAFLTIVLGLSIQCFALQQNLKTTYNQSQTYDNYYIQSSEVYIAPHGKIFVLFDGEPIQVNMLCSDERGTFVPGSEMSRAFVWCPICQRWYDPEGAPHRCK